MAIHGATIFKVDSPDFTLVPSSACGHIRGLFKRFKKLIDQGKIKQSDSVVIMLTGSGLKDAAVFNEHKIDLISTDIATIEEDLAEI